MTLTCADVDFDLKLAEFKINGYAVFEDMIPGKRSTESAKHSCRCWRISRNAKQKFPTSSWATRASARGVCRRPTATP